MDECKPDEESADSFMLKMDIEEDVGAEVEDFVLYARLGLVNDAIAVIHEVLWRHLLFFPALAEIGLFLIEEDNTKELQLMLELLRRQNFTAVLEAEEIRFVDVLDTLLPPGEPAVTSLRNLGPDRCSLLYDKTRDPGVKDRSPIQIQLDQIRFNIFSLCSLSLKDFFSSAREEFLRLLSDNLFWEGTCLFKLCCRAIEDLPVDLTWQQIFERLITMYADIMQAVDEQMLLTVPKADIDGYIPEVTCCLVAKLSCFQAINTLRKHGFSFEDAEGFALLIRARQMMDTLLQFLPDDKLRGKYASCLDKVRIPEIDANTDDPHTLMAWSQWDDLIRSRPGAASGQSNASSVTSSEISSVFSRPRLKGATKSISDISMSTSVDVYAESSSTVTSKLLHSGIGNELPTHQGPNTYEQPRISTSKVLEDAYGYQPSQSRSESSQLHRHETTNVSYTISNRFPPKKRHARTDTTPGEEVVENPTSGQMAPEQYDEDFPFTTLTTPLLRDFARIAIYELDERIEYLENHVELLARETIVRVQTNFLRQAVEFWRMDKAIASASCSYCLALLQVSKNQRPENLRTFFKSLQRRESRNRQNLKTTLQKIQEVVRAKAAEEGPLEAPVSLRSNVPTSRELHREGQDTVASSPLQSSVELTEVTAGRDLLRHNKVEADVLFASSKSAASTSSMGDPWSKTGVQKLDPAYQVRKGSFFQPGKVFAVFWVEGAGTVNKKATESLMEPTQRELLELNPTTSTARYGSTILTHVRRMVVIKNRHGYCWCVSIGTYGGRGLSKLGLSKDDVNAHTTVYDKHVGPVYLKNEPRSNKRPIAVDIVNGQTLSSASRIYLGKPYKVEWNLKVRDVGQVVPEDLEALVGYVREEIFGQSPV